ncbi:MAG TPA: hypothetical protein P5305_04100 [Rubrivivax sp.]|nr:hypothetical protein [Rubrivivax sp.]HRY87045.1 hypothetical protein [Rubrivivax sp.]
MSQGAAMDVLEQITGRAEALRAYAGTEVHTHLVGLLTALKTTYMHDLVQISPGELQLKQGALRQVMALLDAITGPMASMPRI